jgi:hypothetical protein
MLTGRFIGILFIITLFFTPSDAMEEPHSSQLSPSAPEFVSNLTQGLLSNDDGMDSSCYGETYQQLSYSTMPGNPYFTKSMAICFEANHTVVSSKKEFVSIFSGEKGNILEKSPYAAVSFVFDTPGKKFDSYRYALNMLSFINPMSSEEYCSRDGSRRYTTYELRRELPIMAKVGSGPKATYTFLRVKEIKFCFDLYGNLISVGPSPWDRKAKKWL